MGSRWTTTLENPSEKAAFFSLFDEYVALRSGNPTVPTSLHPSPASPVRSTPQPFTPPTPVPTVSPSSRLSNFSSSAQNAVASSALRNTAATSSALRGAGVSPRLAGAASSFGAQHSEQLAPHLVRAAKSQAAGGPPTKGPKPPAGLSGGKSIAGGFSTNSGKDFTKSLFQSKGPMSSEEAKKNAFKEPLAVSRPVAGRTNTPPTAVHAPPPSRGAVPPPPSHPEQGLGRAQALYDYQGDDPTDLQVQEGETVTVVEHVSEDWWKCRSQVGREGLVPVTYLMML